MLLFSFTKYKVTIDLFCGGGLGEPVRRLGVTSRVVTRRSLGFRVTCRGRSRVKVLYERFREVHKRLRRGGHEL